MSTSRAGLTKFAWLSIAAALTTIVLKTGAWWITDSVGLLSDAAESSVNLVAAIVALIALRVAARPEDESHPFGHSKAEYFSAAAEGQMIFLAAVFIIWTAVERIRHPAPIENVGIGLAVSVIASVINGLVAVTLLRAGREHRSLTLVADGRHLLTDVWTSAGVVVGVGLVWVTGIQWLDPVIALLVGLNILFTGWKLLQESAAGLMDSAMSTEETEKLAEVINRFQTDEVSFHGLRTRVSGHRNFAVVHVLVPGAWTVARGHDVAEAVEQAVATECIEVALTTHIEPVEDPRSHDDYPTEHPLGRPAE